MKTRGVDAKLVRKGYKIEVEDSVHTATTSSGKSKLVYKDVDGMVKAINAYRYDGKVETFYTVASSMHYLAKRLTVLEKSSLKKRKIIAERRESRRVTKGVRALVACNGGCSSSFWHLP